MATRRSSSRLFTGPYASLAWSAILLVTLGALANRSVSTILPIAARDTGGLAWFGVISTAPMLVYLVAGPMAGSIADRLGGHRVLAAGMGLFGAGSVVSALAPSTAVLVVGRVLSGIGEAAFDIALVVVIAARIPERLRPKLFAAYSAAWLVPSAIGPQLAAGIESLTSWRWVFGSIALALVVVAVMLAITLRGTRTTVAEETPARVPMRFAWIALAGTCGVASMTWLSGHLGLGTAGSSALGGLFAVLAIAACLRLNPRGVLRAASGLPAVVALATLMGTGFEAVTAYLPLFVTMGAGASVGLAGAFLTATGFCWALGSWLQGLDVVQRRTSARQRIALAFVLIGIGVGSLALMSLGAPVGVALATWCAAGVGMGLGNSTLTTTRIALTPEHRQGSTTAGVNLLVSCGSSSCVMLIGLALRGADAGRVLHGGGVVALAVGALALACALLAGRVAVSAAADRTEGSAAACPRRP